jgi:hypothetical protein
MQESGHFGGRIFLAKNDPRFSLEKRGLCYTRFEKIEDFRE